MSGASPSVFWFYGLSGAGKTTLSRHARNALSTAGIPCLVLDGDDFRMGLSKDLGFSSNDRMENIRRAAEVAALACRQGFVVLAAFITPEKSMREMARRTIGAIPFFEVFVSCDFETCRQRDVKGLYRRSALGQIEQFTGADAIFEPPDNPDLIIDSAGMDQQSCHRDLHRFILQRIKLNNDK